MLKLKGQGQAAFDRGVMQALRLVDEFPLPDSYQNFLETYGFGRALGLLLIYLPLDSHPYALFEHGQRVRELIQEAVAEDAMAYEPDGSRELALRLYPFAESENGEYFCWDLERARDMVMPVEWKIYCVGARLGGVRYAASDLDEMLEALCSPRIKQIMGMGYEPLPPEFQPLTP